MPAVLNHHRPDTPLVKLRRAVGQIGETWNLLDLFLEAGSTPPDPNARRLARQDPPAPVNLDVIVLRDIRTRPDGAASQPVAVVMAKWARFVVTGLRLSRMPGDVPGCCQIIDLHADWVVRQSWLPLALDDLDDCAMALRRAVGDVGRPPVAGCPVVLPVVDGQDAYACGGSLWPVPGAMQVRCDECGRVWTGPSELARLGLLLRSGS